MKNVYLGTHSVTIEGGCTLDELETIIKCISMDSSFSVDRSRWSIKCEWAVKVMKVKLGIDKDADLDIKHPKRYEALCVIVGTIIYPFLWIERRLRG